jgi:1-phosphofructokinase
MRVLTVTPNPALDQTVTLDRLVPGAVHRARDVRQDAGGKGVNVASCLADWGVPVTAAGLLGADNAAPFEALFAAKGIADGFLRVPGATRINLKLVDAMGTTDVNMGGMSVDAGHAAALVEAVAAQAADLAVLSGSLPPGCPGDLYAALVARLRAAGVRVLLDTSGAPLAAALAGAVLPQVVKPNRDELAEWHGAPLPDRAAVVRVARDLHGRGVELVVVSLGGDGALFLSGEGAFAAKGRAGTIASTVGAGDAMVAGIAAALAEGAGLERIARLATAFAVAKLGLAGPHLPGRTAVEAIAADVEIEALPLPAPAGEER